MAKTILNRRLDYSFLQECFSKNAAIIPLPGHAPRRDADAVWPVQRFAQEIASNLSAHVIPALERIKLVPKSAIASPGERPDPPDHYASIKLNLPKLPSSVKAITLVDDVVTRGSTFVAMYAALRECLPDIPIYCFALVRTLTNENGGQIIDPIENVVEYKNGWLTRHP